MLVWCSCPCSEASWTSLDLPDVPRQKYPPSSLTGGKYATVPAAPLPGNLLLFEPRTVQAPNGYIAPLCTHGIFFSFAPSGRSATTILWGVPSYLQVPAAAAPLCIVCVVLMASAPALFLLTMAYTPVRLLQSVNLSPCPTGHASLSDLLQADFSQLHCIVASQVSIGLQLLPCVHMAFPGYCVHCSCSSLFDSFLI